MKYIEPRKTNLLLWLSLLIFTLEAAGIVGYYWLSGGYFGDSSLTISRFVGLDTWSSLVFAGCNTIIVILMLYYMTTNVRVKNFAWRFLMVAYIASFVALSIFPHSVNGGTVAEIHQFFSAAMFLLMFLLGMTSLIIAKNKASTIIGTLFTTFSIFFIVCYIIRPDFFMQNILWFETEYIYAFFAAIISSNNKSVSD